MSIHSWNEKYLGYSIEHLQEKADALYDEISANEDENRAMLAEIECIYKVIGDMAGNGTGF